MSKVGAVIVTYNSARLLPRCVRSLKVAGVADIVVVDNASTDDSVNCANELGVTVVASSTNQGFAAGCNLGASRLPHHTLLFINPDAWLSSQALALGLTRLNDKQVGVVGLGLTSPSGQAEEDSHGPEVTLGELWRRRAAANTAKDTGWVSGGAMLVRGDVFAIVGGFDSDYFLYWEDVDLCKRVCMAGYAVVSEPSAKVWHERGASLAQLGQKTHYYDQSADRYFRKHYATPIWLTQRFLRRLHRWFTPQVR